MKKIYPHFSDSKYRTHGLLVKVHINPCNFSDSHPTVSNSQLFWFDSFGSPLIPRNPGSPPGLSTDSEKSSLERHHSHGWRVWEPRAAEVQSPPAPATRGCPSSESTSTWNKFTLGHTVCGLVYSSDKSIVVARGMGREKKRGFKLQWGYVVGWWEIVRIQNQLN
jgi:hypothetical protein